MAFTVSIRDCEALEKRLKEGKESNLPKECKSNSDIIYEILQHAYRVLPNFKLLADSEVRQIADVVAYMMRTDVLKSGAAPFGCIPLPDTRIPKIAGEDGIKVHLKNNPTELSPEWELENINEYLTIGAELFRCYAGAIDFIPKLYDKLDPEKHSLAPAFTLADMTAFLLSPSDLVDYEYTPEEIRKFHETLDREMEEV